MLYSYAMLSNLFYRKVPGPKGLKPEAVWQGSSLSSPKENHLLMTVGQKSKVGWCLILLTSVFTMMIIPAYSPLIYLDLYVYHLVLLRWLAHPPASASGHARRLDFLPDCHLCSKLAIGWYFRFNLGLVVCWLSIRSHKCGSTTIYCTILQNQSSRTLTLWVNLGKWLVSGFLFSHFDEHKNANVISFCLWLF